MTSTTPCAWRGHRHTGRPCDCEYCYDPKPPLCEIGTRIVPDGAHIKCETCNGYGFLRLGVLADQKFPRCKTCNGIGQIYKTTSQPRLVDG